MTGLKPFFCYYGGKWRAAPLYPRPLHGVIIEPFAGSAGYALRYPYRDVVLYDVDPVVFGVWDYLLHVSELEIMSLPGNVESLDDLSGPQEAKWLVGFWLQTGRPNPRAKRASARVCRPSRRRETQLNWCERVKERVASQLSSIRHWKAYNLPCFDVPNTKATWFVDPPYNNKAGLAYSCKFSDYGRLSEWCKERKGQVVVCENKGAGWLPFVDFADTKSTHGTSKEVIWTKGCEQQNELFL